MSLNFNNDDKIEHLNGLKLPSRLLDEINEASNYFGAGFEEMIYSSINKNLLDKEKPVIKALNESFQKANFIKETLKQNNAFIQSLEENDKAAIDLSCTFWGKIENVLGKQLNIIIETKEAIEGDGEVVEDDDSKSQDNPDQSQDQDNPDQPQEQQLQPEQLLQLELAQTDNKFATLVVYNKIVETLKTIDAIKENVYSSETEDELDLYNQLDHYQTYLEILNELIFVMDINTVYYNLTNIIIELNALFDKYLIATKIKVLNSDSSKEEKKEAKDSLIDNAESNEDLMNLMDERN